MTQKFNLNTPKYKKYINDKSTKFVRTSGLFTWSTSDKNSAAEATKNEISGSTGTSVNFRKRALFS